VAALQVGETKAEDSGGYVEPLSKEKGVTQTLGHLANRLGSHGVLGATLGRFRLCLTPSWLPFLRDYPALPGPISP
jgi:hypothetical protein